MSFPDVVSREALSQTRTIVRKTTGRGHDPIVRLMSPDDLGRVLKPFVFLDLFTADASFAGSMPMHPHSGIATVTVVTHGSFRFDDAISGKGVLDYGGVEWMRAGEGVWHGDELAGDSEFLRGFQLWLALPPELENGPVDSQYLEAKAMPAVGPARVILGGYDKAVSPVRSPAGINYMIVTLQPGERWTYAPPAGHAVAWLAVSEGRLIGTQIVEKGEMAIFEGDGSIVLEASEAGAIFVLGSAIPHSHDLVTGYYSVHTSEEALAKGEARIEALRGRVT